MHYNEILSMKARCKTLFNALVQDKVLVDNWQVINSEPSVKFQSQIGEANERNKRGKSTAIQELEQKNKRGKHQK